MTKRKSILIQKDPLKGTAPNIYTPITCLPMMWKILTAQTREVTYDLLTSRGLLPRNRKDVAKDLEAQESYFTLINTSSTRAEQDVKNLAMAWIDYKKAYDMVPQSWIIHRLKMDKYQTKS